MFLEKELTFEKLVGRRPPPRRRVDVATAFTNMRQGRLQRQLTEVSSAVATFKHAAYSGQNPKDTYRKFGAACRSMDNALEAMGTVGVIEKMPRQRAERSLSELRAGVRDTAGGVAHAAKGSPEVWRDAERRLRMLQEMFEQVNEQHRQVVGQRRERDQHRETNNGGILNGDQPSHS